jgi:hypothetical protein
MRARKDRKKTAFVPRIVFSAAVAGSAVIPICVSACGGETKGEGGNLGVAAMLSDGGKGGDVGTFSVGVSFADTGTIGEAASAPDVEFTVACQCFDAPFGGVANIGFDVADIGFRVADVGFGDGGDAEASDGREGGALDGGVGASAFGDGGDSSSDVQSIPTVAAHGFEVGD